jgi:putative tryptophan/tyrosine transport system substrate-binding protein
MRRREFITLIGTTVAALPVATHAQQKNGPSDIVPRIGYLAPSLSPEASRLIEAFRQGLREIGYVEGRNIILELRSAEGRPDRFPALAAELVALKVDVIVAGATPTVLVLKQASQTIPIVFPIHTDPVGAGIVATLARPGGNATGLSYFSQDLTGKRLQLLKEVLPGMSRIAVLWISPNAAALVQLKAVDAAARSLGVSAQIVESRGAEGLEGAFQTATTTGPCDALLVIDDPFTFLLRKRIVELAAKSHLPAVYGPREFAVDGGLMAYGANIEDMFRRAATYVAKILEGAKPVDLPVQQPTRFDLVINLKTAKALGLTIPQSLVTWADEMIE